MSDHEEADGETVAVGSSGAQTSTQRTQTAGEALHEPRSADPSLEQSMQVLERTLARKGRPTDFSDESLATLFDLQAEYVEDVGLEAIRQARRSRTDLVSAVDVEHGDHAVRAGGRGRAWVEALGGILAGAGTGTFLQVAVADNPSTLGLAVAAGIAAVGLVTTTAALFGRR